MTSAQVHAQIDALVVPAQKDNQRRVKERKLIQRKIIQRKIVLWAMVWNIRGLISQDWRGFLILMTFSFHIT
jgi:hypothetical protein